MLGCDPYVLISFTDFTNESLLAKRSSTNLFTLSFNICVICFPLSFFQLGNTWTVYIELLYEYPLALFFWIGNLLSFISYRTIHKLRVIRICGSLIQDNLLLENAPHVNLLFLLNQSNGKLVIFLKRFWSDVTNISVNKNHETLTFFLISIETHGLIFLKIFSLVTFLLDYKIETWV